MSEKQKIRKGKKVTTAWLKKNPGAKGVVAGQSGKPEVEGQSKLIYCWGCPCWAVLPDWAAWWVCPNGHMNYV